MKKFKFNERVATFVRLWNEVKYNFAFFDNVPELDWEAVLDEYLPRVMRARSDCEFDRLLAECMAKLKDGHTEVWSPSFSRALGPAQPPMRIAPVQGKAVIVRLGRTEEIQKAGLKKGDEITHIDGKDVKEILEQRLYPYIFSSTPPHRDLVAIPQLLGGAPDTPIRLRVSRLDGGTDNIRLTRIRDWRRRVSRRKSPPPYRELEGGISYWAYRRCVDAAVSDFEKHFGEIRKAKSLIIDVRTNGGGSSGCSDTITGHLTDKMLLNVHWRTPMHIPMFQAQGREASWREGNHSTVHP